MYVFKLCTKCNEEKLLDEFGSGKNCLFGKNNHCKKCISDYFKLHKEKNKESYKNRYALDSAKICHKLKTDQNYKRERTESKRERAESKREYNKIYKRNRMATDVNFRMRCNIRSLIKTAIKRKGYKKNSKTFDILGCDYEAFKAYFEPLFKPGMTWENHGAWHIDHIYPVSRATDEKHLIELNHYTNLQPLWAGENFSKGIKII
jgi:hypothetical protein